MKNFKAKHAVIAIGASVLIAVALWCNVQPSVANDADAENIVADSPKDTTRDIASSASHEHLSMPVTTQQGGDEQPVPRDDAPATTGNEIARAAPSLAESRAEVSRDPHSTPESLEAFAMSLAPRVEAAKQDETQAKALVASLMACATAPESQDRGLIVRAFCAETARRVSMMHEVLAAQWPELSQRLPRDVAAAML